VPVHRLPAQRTVSGVSGAGISMADSTHATPTDFAEAPRRYLLTVAHLDQHPENRDVLSGRLRQRANLKALRKVWHLRFDSRFRAVQKRLKAEFLGSFALMIRQTRDCSCR